MNLHHQFLNFIETVLAPASDNIRILMIGDVMGKPGRKVLKSVLHQFKETIWPDLIQINAENIAGGFGITTKIHDEMLEAGVDILTMGNHWNDKPDVHRLRQTSKALVLPQNLKGVFHLNYFSLSINIMDSYIAHFNYDT